MTQVSHAGVNMMSTRIDQALRRASEWHATQIRKSTGVAYVTHLAGVAIILSRMGLDDDVIIAGLLHDAVEDTPKHRPDGPISIEMIENEFGPRVAKLVASCSEKKVGPNGEKLAWAERKREYLYRLRDTDHETRCLALADKLHNIVSTRLDLESGIDVWPKFCAGREAVLENYAEVVETLGGFGDIQPLTAACVEELEKLRSTPAPSPNDPTGSVCPVRGSV